MRGREREASAPWGWDLRLRGAVLLGAAAALLVLVVLTGRLGHGGDVIEPLLVVDPNTAPAPVLLALPRLGPTLVARVVRAREDRPFDSLDDLDRRVRGIGPVTAKSLGPFLRFDVRP